MEMHYSDNKNGYEIVIQVGCFEVSNSKLVELEKAITKAIQDCDCVLLSGRATEEDFSKV